MHTLETTPCWSSVSIPNYPTLEKDVVVDVAVVGGGITGITTAYLLKRSGRTVALLERESLASSDTGHTTAHLTYVTDIRLTDLVNNFDRKTAVAVWEAGRSAIDFIEATTSELQIRCEFKRVPGFLHTALDDRHSAPKLMAEEELARDLGFPASYLDEAPIFGAPAIRFEGAAKFHPRLYLKGLLERIPGEGSYVFEQTEAREFKESPLSIQANGRTVTCNHVVLATHVPLMGNTNLAIATLFQSKLALYTTYAIGARIPQGLLSEALFWDTSNPYHYLRIDAGDDHGYVIFGGADHKTGQVSRTSSCYDELEEALRSVIPEAQVDAHWSGQIVKTNDGLPFVGQTGKNQFVATGFEGNGMTFGTVSAMIIRDAILGVANPWAELLDVRRTKVLGGAWEYLKENMDYPYYLLRDRLKRPEGEAFHEVKAGEAKILKVDGERVAAYRDEGGNLSAVSAVCTHMGCIVHWNDSERTWDCPCHGSRFKPGGEVISGPATKPLKEFGLP